jgi:hypothetical protein
MAKEKVIAVANEPPQMQDEARLTERQLCRFWSITPETLRRWRQDGFGPIYLKMGGRVLYRPEDVRAFEQQMMYRSPSQKIENNGGDDGKK